MDIVSSIGGVLFILVLSFGSAVAAFIVLDMMWNSKGFRKAQKDAAEALLRLIQKQQTEEHNDA